MDHHSSRPQQGRNGSDRSGSGDRPFLDSLPAHDPAEHAYRRVVERMAQHYHVSVVSVLGPSRLRTASLARRHAWFEMRERGYSLTEIGMAAGRDHTTVWEGLRTFARDCGLVGSGGER